MTSSSTVTGRRTRLTAIGREALKAALDADVLGPGDAWIPADLTEPVGLDMAEPDNGTVVLLTVNDGVHIGPTNQLAVQRADSRTATTQERNWHATTGARWSWAELCALPGVSITVLVPRDDDLRAGLEKLHADVAAKATTLHRVAAGAGYAYVRDAINALLHPGSFHLNGRYRDQADSGE